MAFFSEVAPKTASRAWTLDYEWNDAEWMRERKTRNAMDAPFAIYEAALIVENHLDAGLDGLIFNLVDVEDLETVRLAGEALARVVPAI